MYLTKTYYEHNKSREQFIRTELFTSYPLPTTLLADEFEEYFDMVESDLDKYFFKTLTTFGKFAMLESFLESCQLLDTDDPIQYIYDIFPEKNFTIEIDNKDFFIAVEHSDNLTIIFYMKFYQPLKCIAKR